MPRSSWDFGGRHPFASKRKRLASASRQPLGNILSGTGQHGTALSEAAEALPISADTSKELGAIEGPDGHYRKLLTAPDVWAVAGVWSPVIRTSASASFL